MYRVLQASMMGMSLSSYSGRLPKWGLMRNGDIYELQTQVRHTVESDGSVCYPTLSASDGTRGASTDPKYFGESETGALYLQSEKGIRYGMNLTQYVVYEKQSGENWATLTASDSKGTGPYGSKSHTHDLERNHLRGQVIETDKVQQLNPDWGDLFMGYPIGWTDIASPTGED
jgi:hypothetical protein